MSSILNYDVDVDILAGMYGGTQKKKRSQHVQGIKALKATGGNFAFEFAPQTLNLPPLTQSVEVGDSCELGILVYQS